MIATSVPAALAAAAVRRAGGEASLVLPDLSTAEFFGVRGRSLLMAGLLVCLGGLIFGLTIYVRLKRLPVHASMREVSELIYATCKTYLLRQVGFILLLELFIGGIMVVYFGRLAHVVDPVTGAESRGMAAAKVATIVAMSLVGIAGSVGVAWFGRHGKRDHCLTTVFPSTLVRERSRGAGMCAQSLHPPTSIA